MFAEMFGVELAAIVEASTEETAKEEDKKAEKTSLKEENKEVRENVKMKVYEREKPKVPVSLFDVSHGFVRPVVLSKPELDLLPKPIMPHIFKEVNENREVKETKVKVEEEKKAKPEETKKEVYPPKPTGQSVEGTNQSKGNEEFKISDRKSRREARGKPPVHNYPIGDWQAPSGTTDNGKSSADQRSSASDAQPPKGLTDDVKVEKCVEGQSAGKTPSKG